MQLEQMMGYQPRVAQEKQTAYFVVGDLELLSSCFLYDEESERELYNKHISETIRSDEHNPFGEHLNYEVKMNLIGGGLGRQLNLTNIHIPLNNPTIMRGSG